MPITTLPLEHLLASTSQADFPARHRLADLSAKIVKAKKVVVVSGAGISCSSGIPVSIRSLHASLHGPKISPVRVPGATVWYTSKSSMFKVAEGGHR